MKLQNDGRKEIVENVIKATHSAGGDGWSIIVSRYVDFNEIVDFLKEHFGNTIEVHEEEHFTTVYDNQAAIAVMSWDGFKCKSALRLEKDFDEVLVII